MRQRFSRAEVLLDKMFSVISTREDVNKAILALRGEGIETTLKVESLISDRILSQEVRNYCHLAAYSLRHPRVGFGNKKRTTYKDSADVPDFDLDGFDKACKSYEAYKSYTPATSEEAEILERIWSYKVTQFSRMVQYKNPIIYHIPMGGMNKKK